MALLCVIYGVFTAFPIILTEKALSLPMEEGFFKALYEAFITAALPEELIKLIFLYCLIYNHKDFDTPFDGIFYSVFLCMGFAAAENTGYAFHPVLGGLKTALLRSVFSVPCHGIFSAVMGYYLSKSKFCRSSLLPSFAVPFLLHGTYDFILLYSFPHNRTFFLLYFVFLIFICFKIKHKANKGFRKIDFQLDRK